MSIYPFIHLRVASSYSLLESVLTIDDIVKLTKANSMPAVALTDRGNLFGMLEFALQCKKSAIQPIHGAVIKINAKNNIKITKLEDFSEVVLLAKDELGYKNLLKLVSYSFIKNDANICHHISIDDLYKHQEGLILLSGYSDGLIGKYLLEDEKEKAKKAACELKEIFGDRFYFEIMRHQLVKEQKIENAYISLANELNIALVATNNVFFHHINMHEDHSILLAIAKPDEKERTKISNQCFFKNSEQMKALFADLPEAIENSYYISMRCSVMAEERKPMLPKFSKEVSDEAEFLRLKSLDGLEKRLSYKFLHENLSIEKQNELRQIYTERLLYELGIICKMDFAGYFLIVSDIIEWCKKNKIAVGPGRGSGAGSIVAWVLLITDLDPLRFGLLFERFLNPERISMPDFDIDFCQERRGEVVEYVCQKYGKEKVGHIITFGKMQAKAVIKDVARVLGLPYRYAEYLTKLVPFNAVNPVTIEQAISEVEELKQASEGKGLYNIRGEEELIKQVIQTSRSLAGLNRHVSIHAAGLVIVDQDLIELVPLFRDNRVEKESSSSIFTIQYSMKYAELAGLVKFDLLGLQTLTIITKCLELLQAEKINFIFDNINFNDPLTYELLSKGLGTGVFQCESVGMCDSLKKLKPSRIEDIIAIGALYRPGPMENIPVYIACKEGKQEPDYLHPLLEPILQETYGVIIYQEQVLEIAKIFAGYSLGAADLLRRAMGKKIKAEMDAQEQLFVEGAAKMHNIPEEKSKSIFAIVAKFAGYGFNKAHATSYAILTYQTAYLKAHFPELFLIACLNLELHHHEKIAVFIDEAKKLGIEILPPDINYSFAYFRKGKNKQIIYAFAAIKNVGINLALAIEKERELNGYFKDIIDFVTRIPCKLLNKRAFEFLIKSSCFDDLYNDRQILVANVSKLLLHAAKIEEEKASQQYSLISASSLIPTNPEDFLNINQSLDKINDSENVNNDVNLIELWEFEALGLFIKNHPLLAYQASLNNNNIMAVSDLFSKLKNGNHHISIAGFIQKKDSRMSARGRFIILHLSDLSGLFEISIFNEELLKTYWHLIELQNLVVITCEAVKDDFGVRLNAKSFKLISELSQTEPKKMEIWLRDLDCLGQVLQILKHENKKRGASAYFPSIIISFSLSYPFSSNSFVYKSSLNKIVYLDNHDLINLQNYSKNLFTC